MLANDTFIEGSVDKAISHAQDKNRKGDALELSAQALEFRRRFLFQTGWSKLKLALDRLERELGSFSRLEGGVGTTRAPGHQRKSQYS